MKILLQVELFIGLSNIIKTFNPQGQHITLINLKDSQYTLV